MGRGHRTSISASGVTLRRTSSDGGFFERSQPRPFLRTAADRRAAMRALGPIEGLSLSYREDDGGELALGHEIKFLYKRDDGAVATFLTFDFTPDSPARRRMSACLMTPNGAAFVALGDRALTEQPDPDDPKQVTFTDTPDGGVLIAVPDEDGQATQQLALHPAQVEVIRSWAWDVTGADAR